MNEKTNRQRLIREFIKDHPVSDQKDIVDYLQKQGLQITQATVSRDLNEMGVAKMRNGKGVFQYIFPQKKSKTSLWHKLEILFDNFVVSMDSAENQIIIKTSPGNANGIASYIDQIEINGVLGTLAGDDTILIVTCDPLIREHVEKTLKKLF